MRPRLRPPKAAARRVPYLHRGAHRPAPGKLVIATAAAVDTHGIAAAYLSSAGDYGTSAHAYPTEVASATRAIISELCAVALALANGQGWQRQPLFLCSYSGTYDWLERWRQGDTALPPEARPLRTHSPSIGLRETQLHVESSSGMSLTRDVCIAPALHETACALAGLALRTSGGLVTEEQARFLVDMWAQQGLEEHG